MIRICFILHTLKDDNFLSGAEKVNSQIWQLLLAEGFCVDIYCTKNLLKKEHKLNKITLIDEDNFFINAITLANKNRYDITFSNNFAIETDCVYLHEHSRAYRETVVKPKFYGLISSIFARKRHKHSLHEMEAQKTLAQRYKIIFTPSSILKNDLINLLQVNGENIYILPPPIEIPTSEQNEINNDVFTFGLVARGFDNKGGYIFLKALHKIKKYNFKAKIIYPKIPVGKFMKAYVKFLGLENKVEFLPYQGEIKEFYKSIDCLVMPSKRETFGIAALEAMSYGKIAVVSSRCGAKDVIEHDSNGFIFDITKTPAKNLSKILEYIIINKNEFDTLKHNAIYTAQTYNTDKFKNELTRILYKFYEEKTTNME